MRTCCFADFHNKGSVYLCECVRVEPWVSACAGACYHALGYHRSAVRDYDAALGAKLPEDATVESRGQQFLSFYQRELAQYLHARLDSPLDKYFLDKDISPVFKGARRPPMCALLSTNVDDLQLLVISMAPEARMKRKGGGDLRIGMPHQPLSLPTSTSDLPYTCSKLLAWNSRLGPAMRSAIFVPGRYAFWIVQPCVRCNCECVREEFFQALR